MEFELLIDYEDIYGIRRDYPYPIRRLKDHRPVKEWNNGNGYIQLNLNNGVKSEKHYNHIPVAIQFVPNDDLINKKFVDHINHERPNFHISNLIGHTQSTNSRNISSHKGVDYEYIDIDDISYEAIGVIDYGEHEFVDEDYIFD